jgi:K+-sensing histidine kinase KdpD
VIAGQTVSPDKASALAAMIKDDAFHLNGQIQNVFCAAELEAGEAMPQITRVDVASVLRDVADSFGPITRSRGVPLLLEAGEETAGFCTDGAKLRHILANLTANAVQCSPPDQEVKLLAQVEDGWLIIHVVDHGPGLPEAARKAIFAPIAIDWGTEQIQRGHFLGLPVVKALVDILAGNIQVLSGPGAGTAFRIALPPAPATGELQAESVDGNLLLFDEPQAF